MKLLKPKEPVECFNMSIFNFGEMGPISNFNRSFCFHFFFQNLSLFLIEHKVLIIRHLFTFHRTPPKVELKSLPFAKHKQVPLS